MRNPVADALANTVLDEVQHSLGVPDELSNRQCGEIEGCTGRGSQWVGIPWEVRCHLWGDRVDNAGVQKIGIAVALDLEGGEAISGCELREVCARESVGA